MAYANEKKQTKRWKAYECDTAYAVSGKHTNDAIRNTQSGVPVPWSLCGVAVPWSTRFEPPLASGGTIDLTVKPIDPASTIIAGES